MKSPVDVKRNHYYDVPCVKANNRRVMPVLLPSHVDGRVDCINETPEHYHIDFRFCELAHTDGYAAWLKHGCSPVFIKRMKALRESFDSLSFTGESAFFFINRWYRRSGGQKLVGRRCPHKGLQVVNACGRCPGHGLVWDLKTGQLVFELPFFLELANEERANPDNPRGVITSNDKCSIDIDRLFPHDGTVIMVDAKGRRYGQMKQMLPVRTYHKGDNVNFTTDRLCD